jgi:general secretion pathway protein D
MCSNKLPAALTFACLILAGCGGAGSPPKGPGLGAIVPASVVSAAPAGLAAPAAPPASGTLVAPGGRLDGFLQTAAERTPPTRATGRPIVQNEAGEYSLNFVDVEAGEVVRAVLRDVLEVPYLLDEQVQGRITIETPRPVTQAALLPILEAGLRTIGAGLVVDHEPYQILPVERAADQLSPLGAGSSGIVPVRLRHVDAGTLLEALAPFIQDRVRAGIEPLQNLLILSGERDQLYNLLSLIDSLDVSILADTSFALTPLAMAEATVVTRELEAIFANSGGIRFLPIDRQNAILAIARSAEALEASQAWIKRLDRRGGSSDRGIYIYQVESGSALELAATVSALFGLEGGGAEAAGGDQPVAPTLTAVAIADPGVPLPEDGVPPLAAPADQPLPADLLDLSPSAGGGVGAYDGGDLRIVPHEATNTIVVMATEEQWNRIETALRRLDQVPLQVQIEATVAEVTLNDDLRYGVQFALQSGNSLFSLTDSLSLIPDAITPGFAYSLQAGKSITLLLDALSAITEIDVLTSPQLMVTSSETARLQVGDQVPVPIQSATPLQGSDSLLVNTIEFRDTGVILNVTPRVSPSGLISLDISQEVSAVVPTTSSGIDAPTFSQRQVASTVAVQSGETIILGGLTSDSSVRTESGIPGLRQLPVLGPLFGRTIDSKTRTELLVMIKPRIIRNADDARLVASEVRRRLERLNLPDEAYAPPPRAPVASRQTTGARL